MYWRASAGINAPAFWSPRGLLPRNGLILLAVNIVGLIVSCSLLAPAEGNYRLSVKRQAHPHLPSTA